MIQFSSTPIGEIGLDEGIDLGTYRCGKSSLTHREHQILALLNNHFGLMVSWERLLNMLYATHSDGGPNDPRNVVAVIVCLLRRKMLRTGYEIVTVHSEGLLLRHRESPRHRHAAALAQG
jgi:DNA-binding response OmpR family regulator